MNLTQKQEKFVLHYHEHGNAYEAYCFAYNAINMKRETIDSKASRMLREGKISARLGELRGQAQELAQYTALNSFNKLKELQSKAEQVKDLPTAINAEKAIIGLLGLEAPKKTDLTSKGESIAPIQIVIPKDED